MTRLLGAMILTLSVSTACSRKATGNVSVKLAVADRLGGGGNGTLAATGTLTNVMVSITGSDLANPVQYHWSGHDCNGPCAPPTEIALTVPKGDRLIQVLLVYENEDTAKESFYYGDVQKTLSAAVEPVEVTASLQGTADWQGQFAGRYMDASAAGGPTGTLQMYFKPSNGKAPMLLMDNMIFAGWTRLFLLDGAEFIYRLNGQDMFGGALSYNSAAFTPSSKMLHIGVAAHRRDNGSGQYRMEGAQRLIMGFFGPGSGSQVACYDDRSGYSISGVFRTDNTDPLMWSGFGTASAQVGPIAGGGQFSFYGSAGSHLCNTPSTEFVDHMVFNPDALRNGKDSVSGFMGPWQMQQGPYGSEIFKTSVSGGVLSLNFKLLPGVTSGSMPVAGITAFIRPQPADDDDSGLHSDSGIRCSKLGSLGFTVFGNDVVMSPGQRSGSMPLTGLPANQQVILCPYFNVAGGGRSYPDAGARAYLNQGSGSGLVQFKIIGSDLYGSDIFQPASYSGAGPYKLLQSALRNGFHNFAFTAGNQYLMSSDLTSVEVSFDGGSTWDSVSTTYTNYGSSPTTGVSIAPIGSIFSAKDPGLDHTFRLRVTVPEYVRSSRNLLGTTFESGDFAAYGTATCPSPTLQLWDTVANMGTSATSIMADFETAGGTDVSKKLRLKWNGCSTDVYAPVDTILLSGTYTPSGCFDSRDLHTDENDPLLIHINPMSRGEDCHMTNFSFTIRAPSNAGTDSVNSGSPVSRTIVHSTVPNKIGMAVSGGASTPQSYFKVLADFVLAAPSTQHIFAAVNLNSDGMITANTASSDLPASTMDWTVTPSSWWAGSGVTDNNVFNLAAASTPSGAATVNSINAVDGSVTGTLESLVSSTSFVVMDATDDQMWGGTPLLAVKENSTLRLAWIQGSSTGSHLGQALRYFTMPETITNPQKVKLYNVRNTGGGDGVWMAVWTASGTKIYYGQFSGSSSILWAPASQMLSNVADVGLVQNNDTYNIPFLVTLTDNGTSRSMMADSAPSYGSSTWYGTSFDTDDPDQIHQVDLNSVIGFATCGSEVSVVGRDGTDRFSAYPINSMQLYMNSYSTPSSPFYPSLDRPIDISAHDRVTCLGFGGYPGSPGRLFVTYQSNGPGADYHPFESSTGGACGLSANAVLSLTGGTGFPISTFSGTGYGSVVPAQFPFAKGFLTAWRTSSGSPSNSLFGLVEVGDCSAGTFEVNLGGVPTYLGGSPSINPIVIKPMITNTNLGNGAQGLSIFGTGFYYKAHLYK